MQETYAEIDGVIDFIHRNIDEPLPLERLAKHAAYSQFHFTRIFKQKIGLPPVVLRILLALAEGEGFIAADEPERARRWNDGRPAKPGDVHLTVR